MAHPEIPRGQQKVAGTPHWEYEKDDGHCVPPDGFIRGRRRLADIFEDAGHHVLNAYWGNDAKIGKCGTRAWSDGNVAVIAVNHTHSP